MNCVSLVSAQQIYTQPDCVCLSLSQVFPVTTALNSSSERVTQFLPTVADNEKVAVLVQSESQNIIIKQILQKHK